MKMNINWPLCPLSHQKQQAFTIVELLIVIVVIGILAAITVVAYNGMQQRARGAAASSAATQATRKLSIYHVDNSYYPDTLTAAGISNPENITYDYYPITPTNPASYCLTATTASTIYSISSTNKTPHDGDCTENSLVGWWKMNGNANDDSGRGNDGTVSGASLSTGQSGQTNGAYSFDGVSDYISHSTSGMSSQDGSLSVWAYPTKQGGWGIWQTHDQSGQNWLDWISMFAWTDTATYFRMGNGSSCCSNDLTFNTTTYLPVNQWAHLVFTWGDGIMRIHVNGVQIRQRNATFQGSINSLARIGEGHSRMMQGRMDDLRIYNRALSATEAQELFNNGAQ